VSELTYNLNLAEYAVKYVNDVMSKGPGPANQAIEAYHRLVHPRKPDEPEQTSNPFTATSRWVKHKLAMRSWESNVAKSKELLEAKAKDPTAMDRAIKAELKKLTSENDDQREETLKGLGRPSEDPAAAIRWGAEIEKSGLGNCGEQSYVAFKYLVTKGPPSLAIMDWQLAQAVNGKISGNHQFVLIGASSLPKTTEADLEKPPAIWGPFAVICDPWYHEWFAVPFDWSRKMPQILAQTRPDLKDQLVYPREDRPTGYQRIDGESHRTFAVKSRFTVMAVLKHPTAALIAQARKRHDAADLQVLPGLRKPAARKKGI
jgi:hypothetical protein